MNYKKWILQNTTSLQGKTVAITGSTGVLGKEICLHLLSLNANLVLIDRNKQKQDALKSFLITLNKNVQITGLIADNETLVSVKECANKLKKIDIDIFIINAGAYHQKRKITTNGFDNIFQVNFVAPYYLLSEIMPYLNKKQNSKVIVVGSIAHKFNHIKSNDIEFLNCKKPMAVYGNAKRFLMYASAGLVKQFVNVNIALVHPGITPTNITSGYPKAVKFLIKPAMKILFNSPKKSSLCVIKGVFDNCEFNQWIGPRYFNIWGAPKKQNLPNCNALEQKNICDIANKIYKSLENF